LVYKTNTLTWALAKMIVKLKYIGLPNLIMGREIIPELIQSELNALNLRKHLDDILFNIEIRKKQLSEFETMRAILGGSGASRRVATMIAEYMK
jgi:lipid-A-disaccharide synthase